MEKCPQCGRIGLEYSRGRRQTWCRHVVDCGYSSQKGARSTVRRAPASVPRTGYQLAPGKLSRSITPKQIF